MSPATHQFHSLTETRSYTATPRASDGTPLTAAVTWQSSDPSVASVSSSGLVTAVANGGATITASASGKTGTATAQVTQTPAQLSVSTQPGAAIAGAPLDIQPVVRVRDALGTQVGGDNTTVVTATLAGGPAGASLGGTTARSASGGTVTFTDLAISASGAGYTLAFSAPGLSGATSAPFQVVAPVASVQITTVPTPMASLGATQTLTAVARDAQNNVLNGVTFVWETSNGAIASVSGGVVTAVANGSADITARAGGITSAPVPVNVQQVAASVEVSPSLAVLRPTTQQTVTVTVRDARGNVFAGATVTPTSRNGNVMTVTASSITGANPGTAYAVFASGAHQDSVLVAVTDVDGFAAVVSSAAGTSRVTPAAGASLTMSLYFLRPSGGTGSLGAVQGRLEWNEAHLTLSQSTAGAGFSWFPNTADAATGVLRFSAFSAAGSTAPGAEVVIAQLTFNVIGAAGATSMIDLVIDVAGSAPGATITSQVQVLDAAIRVRN